MYYSKPPERLEDVLAGIAPPITDDDVQALRLFQHGLGPAPTSTSQTIGSVIPGGLPSAPTLDVPLIDVPTPPLPQELTSGQTEAAEGLKQAEQDVLKAEEENAKPAAAGATAAPGKPRELQFDPNSITDVTNTLPITEGQTKNLGSLLFETEAPEKGEGFSSMLKNFLSDPNTIRATVFGLAALNSDADNPAGAFMEGLGAVGSAYSVHRARQQQEFQNKVEEERLRQAEGQLNIQRATAEESIRSSRALTAQSKARLQLDYSKSVGELELGYQNLDLRSKELTQQASQFNETIKDRRLQTAVAKYQVYAQMQARMREITINEKKANFDMEHAQRALAQDRELADLQSKLTARGQDANWLGKVLDGRLALDLARINNEALLGRQGVVDAAAMARQKVADDAALVRQRAGDDAAMARAKESARAGESQALMSGVLAAGVQQEADAAAMKRLEATIAGQKAVARITNKDDVDRAKTMVSASLLKSYQDAVETAQFTGTTPPTFDEYVRDRAPVILGMWKGQAWADEYVKELRKRIAPASETKEKSAAAAGKAEAGSKPIAEDVTGLFTGDPRVLWAGSGGIESKNKPAVANRPKMVGEESLTPGVEEPDVVVPAIKTALDFVQHWAGKAKDYVTGSDKPGPETAQAERAPAKTAPATAAPSAKVEKPLIAQPRPEPAAPSRPARRTLSPEALKALNVAGVQDGMQFNSEGGRWHRIGDQAIYLGPAK